ncbi:MAG: extracellular solute-binding protein family 1 [Devosia sp.]|nr:extracellular solute-binding protein family 1 [Devosia sp.]
MSLNSKVLLHSISAVALSAALAVPAIAQDTKTITIATHYNQENIEPILACYTEYEASHPGIKIESQQVSYADFLQTIVTSRVGGTSPDIYNIYSIWAPQLVKAQALAVPPADITDWIKANYAEGTVGAATIGGQVYGIPTELSVYQLVYNKKILAEAGFDHPPATWAELEEMGAAVVKKNDQGVITTAGFAFGPTVANAVHPFYALMYANGTPPFNADYTATNLTSPTAIKVLTDMVELYQKGITSVGNEVGQFVAGGSAMAIMANWQEGGLKAAITDDFDNTVGVAPIPHDAGTPGGTMLYSFLWAVDSTSDVQPEAWELLKWLNTPAADGTLSCTGAMLNGMGALTGSTADTAAMGDSLTDAFSTPYVEAVASGLALTQPNNLQEAQIERILRTYIEQAWAGTLTPTDALTAADAEIQAVLEE